MGGGKLNSHTPDPEGRWMTGSAWTRWTFSIDHYINKGGSLREGRAKYSVGREAGGFLLSVFFVFFSSFFPTSFFERFLVDDGKRLDALDVALRCNIIYKGEGV